MFVLKKKYDLLSRKYLLLNDDYECFRGIYKQACNESEAYRQKALELENINETLRLEKIDLENEVSTLNQEAELYRRTFEDFESDIEKLEAKNNKLNKANKAITSLWNDINRKLWCNKETIRQLRKLSKEIMESDKINKNYIASYLHELSLYISTGAEVEAKIKED